MLQSLFFTLNTFMAIKIPTLEALTEKGIKDYTFKDVSLDIVSTKLGTTIFEPVIIGNDIEASYDTQAITNSLFNLFNTRKGERYLFPEYGTDIHRYLFSPLNDITARSVGVSIKRTFETFEPRVTVEDVQVVIIEDQNSFIVNISYLIIATKQTGFASMSLKQRSPVLITNNS